MSRAPSTPIIAVTLDEHSVEALATRIATKLASAQNGGAGAVSIYTSKSPPPGMSRKRFNELCRQRSSRGDTSFRKIGRVWVAPATAFEKYALRAAPAAGPAEPWSPAGTLESAGVRLTR